MNIFLIGYRCTGKTTVGKVLADRFGWTFVDTDQMAVAIAGISIARMVESHGWPFFREQEHRVLQMVSDKKHQVVATGGGIILDVRNIFAMKNSGKVAWLTANEKIIHTRMLGDETTAANRPPLTSRGLLTEIRMVLTERSPFYEKAADLVIDTAHDPIGVICDRIVRDLRIEKLGAGVGRRMKEGQDPEPQV